MAAANGKLYFWQDKVTQTKTPVPYRAFCILPGVDPVEALSQAVDDGALTNVDVYEFVHIGAPLAANPGKTAAGRLLRAQAEYDAARARLLTKAAETFKRALTDAEATLLASALGQRPA